MDPFDFLRNYAIFSFTLLFFSLIVLVFYQMLVGIISTKNLFGSKDINGVTPERIQTLMMTIAFAFYFITKTIGNPIEFPEISDELLLLIGGSETLFLVFKAKKELLRS